MNFDLEKMNRDYGYCASDSHDFVYMASEKNVSYYRCVKCGLLFASNFSSQSDFYKTFYGSYVDNDSYTWHPEDMQPAQILDFSLSYGYFPIRNISYQGGVVTYRNTINGSRDGGRPYPDGFFDPHTSRPDERQIAALYQCLDGIQLETWKTDPGILDRFLCPGFCHAESFVCTFSNGRHFICKTPEKSDGFHKLTAFMEELCVSLGIYKRDCIPLPEKQQPIPVVVTACCGVTVRENSTYCPKCGKRIENKEKLPHTEISVESEDTSWLCECGASNSMYYPYCVNCGKKRSWGLG